MPSPQQMPMMTCDTCPFRPVCLAARSGHQRCELGVVFAGPIVGHYLLLTLALTLLTLAAFALFP